MVAATAFWNALSSCGPSLCCMKVAQPSTPGSDGLSKGNEGSSVPSSRPFQTTLPFIVWSLPFRTTKLFLDLTYSTQTTAMYQQYMIIPGPHPFLPHLTQNIKRKTTYIYSLFLNSSNVIPFSILFRAIKIWPLCFTWHYLHTGCLSAYDCLSLQGPH